MSLDSIDSIENQIEVLDAEHFLEWYPENNYFAEYAEYELPTLVAR